jgi:hypothetical protein
MSVCADVQTSASAAVLKEGPHFFSKYRISLDPSEERSNNGTDVALSVKGKPTNESMLRFGHLHHEAND